MKNLLPRFIFIFLALSITACAGGMHAARAESGFAAWRTEYLERAAAAGISQQTLAAAEPYMRYNGKVITLDQKQPETTQTFEQYLSSTVTPARIQRAREEYQNNYTILNNISQKTGVPAEVIVALWAKESNFGERQGSFNIIAALSTLAYDGRRAAFFESELTNALKLADQYGIAPEELTGSWAGAMGQCQFMPSSYLKYAADGDGDGRADIWHNRADVFASIANYLRQNGWQPGAGIANQITDAGLMSKELIPGNEQKNLAFRTNGWQSKGTVQPTGADSGMTVQPDGPGGQTYLVDSNYRVLMRWNRSAYFVLAVADLARQINP